MSKNKTKNANQSERRIVFRTIRSLSDRFVEWIAGINMFVIMGVFFVLGLIATQVQPLEQVSWMFFLLGGILPILLATVSTGEDGYSHDMSNRDRGKFVVSQLRWGVTPWGILTQILQIGGTLTAYVRYRGQLPNRDRHVPETELTVPFDGEWITINGGITKQTSHSWGIVAQRYAYDFVIEEDGDTHEGDGHKLPDYHAFGKSIRAPADGIVVKTKDSLRDYPHPGSGWIEWRTWDMAGNHVIIQHKNDEYSLLAHLKKDSVSVEPGDEVEQGEVLGECGNSGASTEPHLHFQIQDSKSFWFSAGLVPRFVETTVTRDDNRRIDHDVYDACYETAESLYLWAGDRVTSTS